MTHINNIDKNFTCHTGLYFIDVLLILALIVAVALVELSVGLMKSITPVNVSVLYEFAMSFILELFLYEVNLSPTSNSKYKGFILLNVECLLTMFVLCQWMLKK